MEETDILSIRTQLSGLEDKLIQFIRKYPAEIVQRQV